MLLLTYNKNTYAHNFWNKYMTIYLILMILIYNISINNIRNILMKRDYFLPKNVKMFFLVFFISEQMIARLNLIRNYIIIINI